LIVHIERLVDDQKIGWFNINLLVWSFLAMFADGYDISAMAFAAPELVKHWHVEASSLGPVLSASLFGILFGAPLLGFLGDRYGRKTAIVSGCVIYGLATFAIAWATNLDQIWVLRFITGIGIGGLMPNTISLSSELSPKRWRATLVILMFTGITLGGSMPGVVAAWLVPQYGWQVLFWIGGIVPVIIAACLIFMLPESVKYLAQHPEQHARLVATARRMRPDLQIAADTRFVSEEQPVAEERPPPAQFTWLGLTHIFGPGLRAITPLLWLCFVTALMANFFLNSWMPLLFGQAGLSPEDAAIASSLYHIGGTAGGVLISLLLDRYGLAIVAVLFLIAAPAVAAIGMATGSVSALMILSTLAGVGVLGAQFGNNAAAGLLYPTAFRAKGVGWALAIGRFGSIAGPLIGGTLIGMKLPMQQLFAFAAIPLLIGITSAAILARLCYVRLGGFQLDSTPAAARIAR
jgi:MFS transporter, AAHS family, 4-hydroxybenzoate transporter